MQFAGIVVEPPPDPPAVRIGGGGRGATASQGLDGEVTSHHPGHQGLEHAVGRSRVEDGGGIAD
jgi:hypothetical protein